MDIFRWRVQNPEKVRAANRIPRKRIYDKAKRAAWRLKRLQIPGYKEKINAQQNVRIIKIRKWLDNYKISIGCVDCGYNLHPVALEFDHVRGKKLLNVCKAKSIAQAKSEIAKCEVRCSNCHAIRTFVNREMFNA